MRENLNQGSEEVEGIDIDEDVSLGEYPIDTLLIRNENRTVHDVVRRIEKGSFIMDPDFQRDFIWPEEKQSKLIESVLMRIPLPVFYLAESKEGKMIVVDGLQRLSTFERFVKNELRLKLPNQKDLDRKRFMDLSPKLQNRVEDCNLILYIIDAKVPLQALLDIFDRVNSGVPLSKQQMRNCLYSGKSTSFLSTESKSDLFIAATGGSLRRDTMRDREFVNRFCSFSTLPLSSYRGDMDSFLANGLLKMNTMSEFDLINLAERFKTGLKNNFIVFKQHAFRKHTSPEDGRSVINASLWDVMSTELSNYSEADVEARAENIRKKFYALMHNDDFLDSITLGTNQVNRVNYRFNEIKIMLEEVMF